MSRVSHANQAGGIYVSPTEFVRFGEGEAMRGLAGHVATRERGPDFFGFGMYLPNPDPVLKKQGKDVRVYRDLRSDAHVGGCIRRRKATVKAMQWRVVRGKASARAAKAGEALFARLDMDALINDVLDAVLFGWQPLEVMWAPLGGTIQPVQVVAKPQEWFHFDAEARLRFRSREQPLEGELLAPRKFLLARQEASYVNPYGFADLSMCFWPTVFKRGGLKFWVTFVEKFGTPWVVGKLPRGTGGPEQDALLDKLEAMVQDAVAVMPDDASIEIQSAEGKGVNTDLYRELLMFCRSEVSIALLGQNQSTEASSTHASAMAGLEVARDIRDGDARLVGAVLTQLLRWQVDVAEGEAAPAPVFELYEHEDVGKDEAARDEALSRAGVRFTRQYWQRVYRLQDGDIEEAPAPVMAAQAPVGEAAFAEGDGVDTAALAQAGDAQVRQWLSQAERIVRQHDEPRAMQDALLAAFGGLPVDELARVMALAFELAQLQGMASVRQEAGE